MGKDRITARNLRFIGSDLQILTEVLSDNSHLMIYSDQAASGKNGAKLMEALQPLVPAQISLSDNLTGQGGDWRLEVTNGKETPPQLLDTEYLQKHYKHSLCEPKTVGTFILPGANR